MVGEERFCSLAHGCKQCPICKSKVGLQLFWHDTFACEWHMMHSHALKHMVQCVAYFIACAICLDMFSTLLQVSLTVFEMSLLHAISL